MSQIETVKINVKGRKVLFEPQVTIFLEVAVNGVTEVLECNEYFPNIISDLAETTPGLGGCQLFGKMEGQLTNLGLACRSTRGSHSRTSLLTTDMVKELIHAFEQEAYPIVEKLNSFSPGETIPPLDEMSESCQ